MRSAPTPERSAPPRSNAPAAVGNRLPDQSSSDLRPVALDAADLIRHACAELTDVLPGIDLARAEFATYRIDRAELTAQEERLVALIKKVEPQLSDAQHGDVTQLLCELTAYNVMQALSSLQDSRPKTKLKL